MNIVRFNKPDNLLPENDAKILKNMVHDIYQTTPLEILYNIDFNAHDFISRSRSNNISLKKMLIKYDNQYLFYYIMYFMYELLDRDIKSNGDFTKRTYKNKLELTPDLLIGNDEDISFKKQELGYLRNKYLHNNQFRDQVDERVNDYTASSRLELRH